MDLRNKITELKDILAEVNKTSHVLNYEFNIKEADKLAYQTYKLMVSFNHKYPSDAIKDSGLVSKNDPYGLSSFKSTGGCSKDRIFGDGPMDLNMLESGNSVNDNYQLELTSFIKPKIERCEFKLKQMTCTPDDINEANQYLKQSNVAINNPLTTTPVEDVDESINLNSLINRVAKAQGELFASKCSIKLHAQWKKFLKPADSDIRFEQDELHSCQDSYSDVLQEYKSQASLINSLMNKVHKYHNATVFVKYQPLTRELNPVLDLRPAEISDLKKHTVKGNSFNKLYQRAIKVLDHIDLNDVNGSLDRIHHVVSLINKDTEIDNADYYDLAVRTVLVKNAVTQDIPYQRSRSVKNSWQTEQEFSRAKQQNISQDKKILKQIQNAGKYLDNKLMPYSQKTLKDTVSSLKTDLLITLLDINKGNAYFDPKITVHQAHVAINHIFRCAVYAKDVRYKKRATDLISWIADNYPNAKISYRQLNPVGHYIYKRNIKNIKKALA